MQKYLFFLNNRFIYFTESFSEIFPEQGENNLLIDLQVAPNIDYKHFLSEENSQNLILRFSDNQRRDLKQFLQHFKVIIAAGGIVQNVQKEFLLIFRNGVWDLPKGKAEKGESSQETALREVEEECGIKDMRVNGFAAKTYHIYVHDGVLILKKTYWYNLFISNLQEPKPQTEEGITMCKWINVLGLKECLKNTYPNIKLLLEVYVS